MQSVASTRPSSVWTRCNLRDGATCTTRFHASTSLEAKLKNHSLTCFHVKQATRSQCVPRVVFILLSVLLGNRQIKARLILMPKARNCRNNFEDRITKL
jgi:hypothetical protein